MIFGCLNTRKRHTAHSSLASSTNEKVSIPETYSDDDDVAVRVTFALHNDSHSAEETRAMIENTIEKASWWNKSIAERVLRLLETALAARASMGPSMKQSFERALESAREILELTEEFATEHPILVGVVCTVLALGILYLLAPAVIEALGFTELGPARGSFAAGWHSLYGPRVPLGSVFSYLQRLGMRWNGSLLERAI